MRSVTTLLLLGALSSWLVGCVTTGPVYDDSKVALIQREVTSEADLLQWFGPASSRTMAPDGSKILSWRFGPSKPGGANSGRLEVRLSPNGKVTSYNATGGMR